MIGWDPFAGGDRRVARLGGRFARGFPADAGEGGEDGALFPAADVFEDTDGMVVEVTLAGVRPEDVAVYVSHDAIVVEAERGFSRNGREVLQLESSYGRLRREFPLPIRAEPERLAAELRNGVLRIRVPRAPRTGDRTLRLVPAFQDASDPVAIS